MYMRNCFRLKNAPYIGALVGMSYLLATLAISFFLSDEININSFLSMSPAEKFFLGSHLSAWIITIPLQNIPIFQHIDDKIFSIISFGFVDIIIGTLIGWIFGKIYPVNKAMAITASIFLTLIYIPGILFLVLD